MIRVSIWTAFFLIILRVCIGWHFFFEGVGKVKSAYMGKSIANEKPFSSDAFFKESEGWFGKQMKKWIGDPDQELVDDLTLDPRLGDAAKDSDKDRFPKALGKEWDEYLTRFVSQFHLDDATKARAETKLALAKSKYVKWVQGFSDEIDSESKKPKKLTLKVKRKAPGGSATADFDQEMIVSARLAELLKKSAEVRSVYDQKLPLLGKEVGGADLRAMKQDVATIRAELQKEIETQTTAMKDDLASVFDNRVTGFAKKVDNKDETATLQSMLTPIKAGQNPLGRLWSEYADYVKDFAPGLNEAQKADIDPRLKAAEERFDRWLADRDETTGEPSTSKEVAEWRQNYAAAIAKQSAATTALAGQKEPLKTDIEATKKYQVFTLAKAETDADVKTLTTQMQAELKRKTDALKNSIGSSLGDDKAKGYAAPDDSKHFGFIPKWKPIEYVDWTTRWFLTVVGSMLIFGLFTRFSCFCSAGFLLLTVLTQPSLPWLPVPPNSEGNYLFVNKNVIEMIALLVLMTTRTGRWAGLDAIIEWMFGKNR